MKHLGIKHRYTGEILYSGEAESIKELLERAVKENANLRNANLENSIKMPIYCKWSHGITNENLIHIGCEKRTIEEWDVFFASKETLSTPRNTSEFKQIEAVYLAYKAYLIHLKS